ncbi:Ribosomal RNA large subunit methyltransferase G [Raoultella terrigena]|uniref:Ribosomal RNA large subunit methyltransferase G n=1 Tax=Raoultella terrigena TaxID=577 RepID=A0A4U9D0T2_RAOTE|nr:Ribosomal RNA large subunit methyltransferase G [Raoultella terrigena]
MDDTEINGPVLILNDTFGALSCALAEHTPYSIGDSYLTELATRENLRHNDIAESSVKFLDSTAEYPQAPGVGADKSAENDGATGAAAARRCAWW